MMMYGVGVRVRVGVGSYQVWLHLSSLGFTFEMCMCIYTQSSIKLCKASCASVWWFTFLTNFHSCPTSLTVLFYK